MCSPPSAPSFTSPPAPSASGLPCNSARLLLQHPSCHPPATRGTRATSPHYCTTSHQRARPTPPNSFYIRWLPPRRRYAVTRWRPHFRIAPPTLPPRSTTRILRHYHPPSSLPAQSDASTPTLLRQPRFQTAPGRTLTLWGDAHVRLSAYLVFLVPNRASFPSRSYKKATKI
jgi:hypothetical protein